MKFNPMLPGKYSVTNYTWMTHLISPFLLVFRKNVYFTNAINNNFYNVTDITNINNR